MATASTPWGYTVETEDGKLPPLISVADFRALAPNLSATEGQLEAVLGNVSQAVRDWCGWHVGPSLACSLQGEGEGRLLMLPAMGVTEVRTLSILTHNGVTWYVQPASTYEWTGAGMVRLKCALFPEGWRNVICDYTAGFGTAAIGQAVAQIAMNALVASPGVREEHAGSVGITYNQTGSGISGGVSILARDYDLLAPYRLARSW